MTRDLDTGGTVGWSWVAWTGAGRVTEWLSSRLSPELYGTEVGRHASQIAPAIGQGGGELVLKSSTEVS